MTRVFSTVTSARWFRVDGTVAGTLTADFDGARHTVSTRGALATSRCAYAITIHKSQGSEFPVVIIPLLKAHFHDAPAQSPLHRHHPRSEKVILVGEPAASTPWPFATATRSSAARTSQKPQPRMRKVFFNRG